MGGDEHWRTQAAADKARDAPDEVSVGFVELRPPMPGCLLLAGGLRGPRQ